MSQGHKTPLPRALAVAEEIQRALADVCERIEIAGSIRRRKHEVGDIEIVFIPRMIALPTDDFFAPPQLRSAMEDRLDAMIGAGVLAKRTNALGCPVWGRSIKLARHIASGIGVDLFATTPESWHNYMVCRTGPMESNKRIATRAQERGWKWHPTETGFERMTGPDAGRIVAMHSEREVFEFVGLEYKTPEARNE